MRRGLISVAIGGALAAMVPGLPVQAGATATRSISVHAATVKLAAVVNVAALPGVDGHAAGTGALRRAPLRTVVARNAGGSSASTAAAPESTLPLLSIASGAQRTPALADSNNTSGLTPPDMAIGADATHVVQMVNVVGRVWTGTSAGPVFQLSAFFGAGTNFLSDPWLFFDRESGHWFAGIGDFTLAGERIAVSQTGNPAGTWFVYAIQYPGTAGGGCPDQGKGGVDNNVLALGFNEFSGVGCTGGFLGAALEVFNKAQMISGASVSFSFTNPHSQYFSLVPAQTISSGQTTQYFAGHDNNTTSRALHRVTSTGVPGVSTVVLTPLADLTLAHTYPAPPKAVQKGTTVKLDSGDQRMQHVVWKSGVGLLMTWGESCKPSGDTAKRACGRVVATNDGVGSPTVTMDRDLDKKAQYYVYPAATLNSANDVVVTVGVVSRSLFPQLDGVAATVGGAFGAPIVLATGSAANTTGRYGDYNAVTLDPSGTANRNVWAAGEIGGPVSNDWRTAIREINVTP